MPTWLAIVLGVFVVLVIVLAVGGVIARRRQLEANRGRFDAHLAQVNEDLAAAHAAGPRLGARGPRGRRPRGLRGRARRRRAGASSRSCRSSIVPGTDDDKAVFRVTRRPRRAAHARPPAAASGCSSSSPDGALHPGRPRPGALAQPGRVDLAPDRAGARPPADRRTCVAYHAARARGGVGAIFLEATAVDPSGLLTSHTLGGFLPGIVPGYRAARRRGARARRAGCFVQLFHGGREQISAAPRAPAGRAVGGPVAALRERAARADGRRAARADRRLRDRGAPLPRGRDRRHRGLDVARLPDRAVLLAALEPAHRRLRRRRPRLRFADEVLEAVRDGGRAPGWRSGCGSRPTSWRRTGSTPPRAPRSRASCARRASSTSPRSCSATRRTWRRRAGSRRRRPRAEAAIAEPLAAVARRGRRAGDRARRASSTCAAAERLVESRRAPTRSA